MLNVHIAQTIIILISSFLAYVLSVTIAGFTTAWVSLKLGDDTPEQHGFLTLNPLAHIDIFGVIFLMIYSFGWGKFIPINPFNMSKGFRFAKALLAFLTKPITYFVLAVISLLSLIALLGPDAVSFANIMQGHPNASAYSIALGIILLSIIYLNMTLSIISLCINMCGLFVMFFMDRHPEYMGYSSILMIIIPIIVYFLFGQLLLGVAGRLLYKITYFLATLLHIF